MSRPQPIKPNQGQLEEVVSLKATFVGCLLVAEALGITAMALNSDSVDTLTLAALLMALNAAIAIIAVLATSASKPDDN